MTVEPALTFFRAVVVGKRIAGYYCIVLTSGSSSVVTRGENC
jgi:hypothetical protein